LTEPAQSKVAAVSMVMNEADIIESFIRINSHWANHFFIADNDSCDNTAYILDKLCDEGFPITLTRISDVFHRHQEVINALVNEISHRSEFDFIFPIDADEFITESHKFLDSLSLITAGQVGRFERTSLVPNDANSMQRLNPLFNGFARPRSNIHILPKIILSNAMAKTATIALGNHYATDSSGLRVPEIPLPVTLYHIPVRSKSQIIAKAVIGSNKLSINEMRAPGEIFHWDLMADAIRENRFNLTDDQFRFMALSYELQAGSTVQTDVTPISLCPEDHMLKYADPSGVNLPMLLDGDQLPPRFAKSNRA
jgi:hypothetical protein